jgi:hypothetical protein
MDLTKTALRIIEQAQAKGITLRLLGALAFQVHCPKHRDLLGALGRVLSDIDFAGLSRQWQAVCGFLEDAGFEPDIRRAALNPGRLICRHPQDGYQVDVFFDKLEMCHTIDFSNRLDIDPLTLTVADLLLEKMQIVRITEKDLMDTFVLLLEHDIGTSDEECVNVAYISGVLSRDWGFSYTVKQNLKRLSERAMTLDVPGEYRDIVLARIDSLIKAIDAAPKTLRWRLRGVMGTRVPWYREVEELNR